MIAVTVEQLAVIVNKIIKFQENQDYDFCLDICNTYIKNSDNNDNKTILLDLNIFELEYILSGINVSFYEFTNKKREDLALTVYRELMDKFVKNNVVLTEEFIDGFCHSMVADVFISNNIDISKIEYSYFRELVSIAKKDINSIIYIIYKY